MTKLVIDTDLIAFKSAAIDEVRDILVTHKDTGWEKVFKNRTEFWGKGNKRDKGWIGEQNKQREESGKPLISFEDFDIEDRQFPPPESHSCQIAKQMIQNLVKDTKATEIILPTGGKNNFRDDLATIVEYKGNRKSAMKPVNVDVVKDYIAKRKEAVVVEGMEVDDYVSIMGLQGYVMTTTDKDSYQTNGALFYNYDKMDKPFLIPKQGVGRVWIEGEGSKAKLRFYGLKAFIAQMLLGDEVDNILPKHLTKVSYGKMSLFKDLDPLQTVDECIRFLVAKYKEYYPEPVTYNHWKTGEEITKDWMEIALEIGTLLWMKRSEDDVFTLQRIREEYIDDK